MNGVFVKVIRRKRRAPAFTLTPLCSTELNEDLPPAPLPPAAPVAEVSASLAAVERAIASVAPSAKGTQYVGDPHAPGSRYGLPTASLPTPKINRANQTVYFTQNILDAMWREAFHRYHPTTVCDGVSETDAYKLNRNIHRERAAWTTGMLIDFMEYAVMDWNRILRTSTGWMGNLLDAGTLDASLRMTPSLGELIRFWRKPFLSSFNEYKAGRLDTTPKVSQTPPAPNVLQKELKTTQRELEKAQATIQALVLTVARAEIGKPRAQRVVRTREEQAARDIEIQQALDAQCVFPEWKEEPEEPDPTKVS